MIQPLPLHSSNDPPGGPQAKGRLDRNRKTLSHTGTHAHRRRRTRTHTHTHVCTQTHPHLQLLPGNILAAGVPRVRDPQPLTAEEGAFWEAGALVTTSSGSARADRAGPHGRARPGRVRPGQSRCPRHVPEVAGACAKVGAAAPAAAHTEDSSGLESGSGWRCCSLRLSSSASSGRGWPSPPRSSPPSCKRT